jgi:hypothetical protein
MPVLYAECVYIYMGVCVCVYIYHTSKDEEKERKERRKSRFENRMCHGQQNKSPSARFSIYDPERELKEKRGPGGRSANAGRFLYRVICGNTCTSRDDRTALRGMSCLFPVTVGVAVVALFWLKREAKQLPGNNPLGGNSALAKDSSFPTNETLHVQILCNSAFARQTLARSSMSRASQRHLNHTFISRDIIGGAETAMSAKLCLCNLWHDGMPSCYRRLKRNSPLSSSRRVCPTNTPRSPSM